MTCRIALCLLFCSVAFAEEFVRREVQGVSITPCGRTDIVSVGTLATKPSPPIIPGTFTLLVDGGLSEDMPRVYIRAKIIKRFFDNSIQTQIPCISGYGSCLYDICDLTKDVGECPDIMNQLGIACKCPFNAFQVKDFSHSITVGPLPTLLNWLKDGDYTVKAEILDSPTATTPKACYTIEASILSKPAGPCGGPLAKYLSQCKDVAAVGF